MAITFEIELPADADQPEFTRADLTFYGLDHSGPSYEVRVFFDHPDADPDTPLSADAGFAGKYSVFGHGGCFGEEGHCEIRAPVSAFDRRQPHPLVPAVRILTVTDAIRDLVRRDARASPSPLSPSSAHHRWPPQSSLPMCWSSAKSPCTPSNNAPGALTGAAPCIAVRGAAPGNPCGDASDHLETGPPISIHRHPRVQPRIHSASRADRRLAIAT